MIALPQLTIRLPRVRLDGLALLALIYFFINTVGLPAGLLYTSLLSPWIALWMLKKRALNEVCWLAFLLAPFVVAHLAYGVDLGTYAVSLALFLTVAIPSLALVRVLRRGKSLDPLFRYILTLNFGLACLGLLIRPTPLAPLMWRQADIISANLSEMARFRMFTYEPSYYSTLLAPFALYALITYFRQPRREHLPLVGMALLPLALSYSFGVISALLIAGAIVGLLHGRHLLTKRVVLPLAMGLAVLAVVMLMPGSSFMARLTNVLTGVDSSGKARTFLSYLLALDIAGQKNLLFGVGFGQIKVLGNDFIAMYWGDGRLPAAMPETLAQFGFLGVALRLGLLIFLFVKTKVHTNYYRLTLFLFMFVYQFTGSFLTNLAEYVSWVLAFSPVFPQFAIPTRPSRRLKGAP